MANVKENTSTTANAEKSAPKQWELQEVERALKLDLKAAISLLQVIESDPRVFALISEVIHERVNENLKNKANG